MFCSRHPFTANSLWVYFIFISIFHSLFARPPHDQPPLLARWLVHVNSWGVVSTTSLHLGDSIPYGNALSYSDGPLDELSTGRLLFYLTTMDATAQDLLHVSPNATLTLCEAQLPGGCADTDPEDPTCAKLSITGSIVVVPEEEREAAEELLFSRHPAMRSWPAGHAFAVYELHPTTLRLLDYYGGPIDISPEEYFSADPLVGGGGNGIEKNRFVV